MKKLLYFACAVFSLTALAVSCEKNPIEPVNPDEGSQVRTFTCVIADNPDSKLAIDGTGKSTWEVGDEISIHGGANGASRAVVTLTAADISSDGKTYIYTIKDDLNWKYYNTKPTPCLNKFSYLLQDTSSFHLVSNRLSLFY